jgi:hypothetical protein
MTNPHEKANRARKVLRVVTCLLASGMTTEQLCLVVPSMTEELWEETARKAGIPPRSGRDWNKPLLSAETRKEIIAELKRLSGTWRVAS